MPASWMAFEVPPVETISTPSSWSDRARSTMPDLSETEISARVTLTSVLAGSVGALAAASAVEFMMCSRCAW